MVNTSQSTYNYLNKYLIEVRSQGRYAFTLDEIENKFNTPYQSLRQILYRLKRKNEIVQIRQGFYVIIPREYSKQGIIPPYLYITIDNDLLNGSACKLIWQLYGE